MGSRLENVPPARFIAVYLGAWVDYYRTHRREMVAIAELCLYVALTVASTIVFERSLLAELFGYLRRGVRAAPAPG